MLRNIYRILTMFLFDPISLLIKFKAMPDYFKNAFRYSKLNTNRNFNISFIDTYFTTSDKYSKAGVISGHYFFQDLWAAKKIFEAKTTVHYDVGSRIDGFIAHILSFCQVNYIDIRHINNTVDNLHFIPGNILSLPFENDSINSLSCLHVIEHIGLGRYGDDVDPDGYIKAAKELSRVLSIDGKLLLGTPIGKEKLCFDAHRIFSYETIINIFNDLDLLEFNFIPDKADKIVFRADPRITVDSSYGCGLFVFTKKL